MKRNHMLWWNRAGQDLSASQMFSGMKEISSNVWIGLIWPKCLTFLACALLLASVLLGNLSIRFVMFSPIWRLFTGFWPSSLQKQPLSALDSSPSSLQDKDETTRCHITAQFDSVRCERHTLTVKKQRTTQRMQKEPSAFPFSLFADSPNNKVF